MSSACPRRASAGLCMPNYFATPPTLRATLRGEYLTGKTWTMMALLKQEESFRTRRSGSARCCRRPSASGVRRKHDRWGCRVARLSHLNQPPLLTSTPFPRKGTDSCQYQCRRECPSLSRQGCGDHLLQLPLPPRVSGGLRIGPAQCVYTHDLSSSTLRIMLTPPILSTVTLIIFGTAKLVSWKSTKLSQRYPVGRRRLQPLGTLAFSIIMVLSFAQILQESVSRLMSKDRHIATLPASAIASMVGSLRVGIIGQCRAVLRQCYISTGRYHCSERGDLVRLRFPAFVPGPGSRPGLQDGRHLQHCITSLPSHRSRDETMVVGVSGGEPSPEWV